jgi:SAM-dependent methyltransferase
VRTSGKTLLDVDRGTGGHLAYLKHYYVSEGLDLDPNLLAIARERHPELPFHHNDMVQFDLGHTFDAVVCLLRAAVGSQEHAHGGVGVVGQFGV